MKIYRKLLELFIIMGRNQILKLSPFTELTGEILAAN